MQEAVSRDDNSDVGRTQESDAATAGVDPTPRFYEACIKISKSLVEDLPHLEALTWHPQHNSQA